MEHSSSIDNLVKVEETPLTDQVKPGSGPFQLFKPKEEKEGLGGLVWIGVPETCDRCGERYPMSWITITNDGKRFLCVECEYAEMKLMTSEYAQECEVCHSIVSVHDISIEYNTLICLRCLKKKENDEAKYSHLFED